MKHFNLPNWSFDAASTVDVRLWAYGTVETIEDLYSEVLFGAAAGLTCRCGKVQGQSAVGLICNECGVVVTEDAVKTRRRRLGMIKLVCLCGHPLDSNKWIDVFPVAPIAYRLGADHEVTKLGKKYEQLLSLNTRLLKELPPRTSPDFFRKAGSVDPGETFELLCSIIGVGTDRMIESYEDDGAVLPIFLRAVCSLDPDASYLARASLIALDVAGRA